MAAFMLTLTVFKSNLKKVASVKNFLRYQSSLSIRRANFIISINFFFNLKDLCV